MTTKYNLIHNNGVNRIEDVLRTNLDNMLAYETSQINIKQRNLIRRFRHKVFLACDRVHINLLHPFISNQLNEKQ